MDDHSDGTIFAYTIYIHATPERVWQGLTEPTLTSRWWRHHAAAGVGMDEEMATAWRAEPRSTVAFDLDSDDKGVAKLTVVHGVFGPASKVHQGISAGWPAVLSSLKTILETGSPLPW
jgi:uncharacterized protein YndB with AHSA1/START domain